MSVSHRVGKVVGGKKRVLVVVRDFFPLATDSSLRVLDLCNQLAAIGMQPTVLTPARHSNWPEQIVVGSFQVFRLPPLSSSRLSWRSDQKTLRQWVLAHRDQFDLLYFDQLHPEIEDLLCRGTAMEIPPTVLRFDPRPVDPRLVDSMTMHTTGAPAFSSRMKAALESTERVLAPSTPAMQILVANGIQREKIDTIADRSYARVDRSIGSRRQARHVLTESGQELHLKQLDRFLIIPSDLSPQWLLQEAIRGIGPLLSEFPRTKVWILGDGPQRFTLYNSLKDRGLHYQIALPGILTDPTEVLQAADLCLLPAEGVGMTWWARICAKSRIPLLTSDSIEARALFGESAERMTFQPSNPASLRNMLRGWMNNSDDLEQECIRLQDRLMRQSDTQQDTVDVLQREIA